MDELQISGKRFISARRIARENGYTSDYIGQLIRGGKIVGQKVGRAWYVDASSFERYLGSEATEIPSTESERVSVQEEIIETPVEESAEVDAIVPQEDISVLAQEEGTEEPMEQPVVVEEISTEEKKSETAKEEPSAVEMTPATVSEIVEEKEVEISEAPIVAHKVPLRISKKENLVSVDTHTAGLRYYADDVPALPELKREDREALVASVEEQEISSRESRTAARNGSSPKARIYATGLAIVGITVFMLSAFFSSALSLNLSITEENTAAASYSLHW